MKIIEIISFNDNINLTKFMKSCFVLLGLAFVIGFSSALIEDIFELDFGSKASILIGIIIGVYFGMCIQKTNWKKNDK